MVKHSRHLRSGAFAAVVFLFALTTVAEDKFDGFIKEGAYDKAVEYAEKKLDADSRTIPIWVGLATAYRKIGQDDKALDALKAAQKVNPSDPLIYMEYADFYYAKKKVSEALENYQKTYVLDRSARGATGIAVCAARLKDWDKARDAAESAVNLDSTVYEPRLILIDLYMEDGLYAAAAEQLQYVVKKHDSEPKFWKQLALCYDSTGNTAGLAKADEKIVALDKNNVPSRNRLAQHLLSQKKTDKAYELYKEIAVLTPNDPKPFEQLYLIAKSKDNSKDATLYLKNYLLLDSTNASYQKQLGDLLYEGKNADEALDAYRMALRLDPEVKGIYKKYATIVIDKKLEDEAISVITRSIEAKEADAVMFTALGDIYKKRNKHGDAIKMYEEALKTDVKNLALLNSLAETQALNGELKNAANTYQQIVLLNPEADQEFRQLGDLNKKLGKEDNAIEAYKKYLAKKPDDFQVARTVGMYEHEKKQYDEAIKYLTKVKDQKLHSVAYLVALADCYFKSEKYKQAAEQFALVIGKKPDQKVLQDILKPLGESYEKIGQHIKAAQAYDQYEMLPGISDADVAFKRANLREKTDESGAVEIYEKNTTAYPKDFRNFMRLGLIWSKEKQNLSKAAGMLEKTTALVDTIPEVWKTLGDIYGKLNRADKELSAYQKFLALKPQDIEASKRVGLILLDKGNVSDAIINLEVALTGASDDVEVILALGEGYMKTDRPEQAAQTLAKAKKIKPGDVTIRLALLKAYAAADMKANTTKEKKELAELDKSIVEKDSKNVDSRRRLAQYALENNDPKTAYSLYQDLSTLTPEDTMVFKRLFMIASKSDKKKEAVKYLKDYIKLDSTTSGAYKSLGNLLYEQKDMDGALDAFRRAVKIDPKITGLYKNYTDIVLRKKLEDEAVEVIRKAISAGEAETSSYIALGNIYRKRKQWTNAIEMYQKALEIDTKNVGVLTSLAECQAAGGDTKNAIITYEQVVLINPDAVSELEKLGDLHMQQKNTSNAISNYKKYLKKNNKDDSVAKTVGLYEYEKKKYTEAIHYLSLVKEKKLRDSDFLTALGLAFYHSGEFAKATEMLSALANQKPSVAIQKEILRPLAESYEKISKPIEAANAYEQYSSIKGVSDEDASFKKAYLREEADRQRAVKMYAENVKLFPKDHRNFLRLGLIYSKDKNQLKNSASMLSKAATLVDTLPVIWQTLGRVHGGLKNTEYELKAYKKLLTLKPQDLEANKRVGMILLEKGKVSEAITNLEMAQTAAPRDVELMLLLSQGYEKTKRQKQAIDLLAKAKKIKTTDDKIRMQLYKLYKHIGKEKNAEEEIKGLIALTGKNEHRQTYAADLIADKRYDEALKHVKEIRGSDPMNIEGMMLLATIQQAQNKLNEAIETYKMISYVNEAYAPALSARGDAYLKQNQLGRAQNFYEKALQVDSKFALAELGLARVAKMKKDIASYQKHLNKAKALDPENNQILTEFNGH
ncbi:MAG: tetratricopeptide repeat protein [Chitinivibrionales bacterium]